MIKKITLLLCFFYLLTCQPLKAQTPELWGTTYNGGSLNNYGSIFKIDGTGNNYQKVKGMVDSTGVNPDGDLIKYSDMNLYGVATLGGAAKYGSIFSINPTTGTYTDDYDFNDDSTDSNGPTGTLLAVDSLMYGFANGGGKYYYGAIFSFNPVSKKLTILHNFNDTTGGSPTGGKLLLVDDTVLYGITTTGTHVGWGVLFKLDLTDNTYTDVHDFDGTTGAEPRGNLIEYNGVIYGTTSLGGASSNGVIYSFDISTSTYTDIYDLADATGSEPYAGMVNVNGIFYGTTTQGGYYPNSGVIYSYDPVSKVYTDLHDFNNTSGGEPTGSLCLASNNILYGLTYTGGQQGAGTIFEFDQAIKAFIPLYSFYATDTDGYGPQAGLIDINNVSTAINKSSVYNEQLSVYPNPTTNQFTVESAQVTINEIKITNVLGQIIYNSFPNQNKVSIEIKDDGIYFVTVTSADETTAQKLVVSR